MGNRGYVRADRYAVLHLRAEHNLLPTDTLLVYALRDLVDWRTGRWTGTCQDLAADLGLGRATVAAALVRLSDFGIVKVVEPFRQNRRGCISLLVYEEVTVPLNSRSIRAENALGNVADRAYDQPKRAAPKACRDGGVADVPRAVLEGPALGWFRDRFPGCIERDEGRPF